MGVALRGFGQPSDRGSPSAKILRFPHRCVRAAVTFRELRTLSAEPWGYDAVVVAPVGLIRSKKSPWSCRFRGSSFDVCIERGPVCPDCLETQLLVDFD